jgi:hypothetical protein
LGLHWLYMTSMLIYPDNLMYRNSKILDFTFKIILNVSCMSHERNLIQTRNGGVYIYRYIICRNNPMVKKLVKLFPYFFEIWKTGQWNVWYCICD